MCFILYFFSSDKKQALLESQNRACRIYHAEACETRAGNLMIIPLLLVPSFLPIRITQGSITPAVCQKKRGHLHALQTRKLTSDAASDTASITSSAFNLPTCEDRCSDGTGISTQFCGDHFDIIHTLGQTMHCCHRSHLTHKFVSHRIHNATT